MDQDFYRHLLEEIADGVYFVNNDRRITYWNAGAEHITGYTAAEVVGHSCAEGILRHVTKSGTQLCLQGCPLAAVMKYYHLEHGRDNLDFEGSEDQKNFEAWHGQATKNI